MATTAWVVKQKRREALVKKYAELRRQLEEAEELRRIGEAAARFQPDAVAQPLSIDGPFARRAAEVQNLADHASGIGAGRQDPRPQEGELVKPRRFE